MAGAGPISETLPVVSVPSMLVDGGRFLKWDDQDLACSIYILEVDQLGHVLSWKPEDFSKDTEVLDLVHVRDVRTGQYAKVPKLQDIRARDAIKMYSAFEHESNLMQERTITIVYGSNFVDLTFINFVASSVSEAQEWTDALFKCTNNLLEFNSSPLKCLERFFTRIYVQKNQEGEIPTKILVKAFVNNKEDKKRAYGTLQSVGIASGKKETILVKDFTFERFLAFYNRFVTRHDLDGVFAELGAKNKPYLTTDQLVDFLNNRQRDPRLNEILFPYYDISGAQAIVNTYEPNKAFADKGYISIDGLTKFLMSSDANILLPGKLQIHQDLTFPVAHYFINSSHNTYLQGHQLTGKSSVEIYRQVLLAGCRCIELDCWDGRTEEQEPVITHGMTLCTEVPFKDVIEAIKESAFKTSEYPVILSFENHCSAKQQKKMASYCLQIFGDLLLNKELEECPLLPGIPLPSPKMLKRKILIKNKKRDIKVPVSETKNSNLFAQSIDLNISGVMLEISNMEDIPEDGELKEVVPKSEEEETPEVEAQQELSELVNYFQPVHFRGFERAEKVKRYYEMSSFSENAAMNLLKEQPVEFVNYNKFQASRIYPKGSRVSSDNYIPQLFWNAGCQLVALNFQTLDVPMQLNLGKFEINGRCGYLLKPEHMRRHDRTFDPFVESTVDGIIAGTVQVRVISGQCLLERRSGTYVEVEMYGLPADTVRRKYRTKVVSNNGLNPVYDEEPFKFKPHYAVLNLSRIGYKHKGYLGMNPANMPEGEDFYGVFKQKVILPHLAELRISVYEENGKMIGHRVLPVDGLSPGYRHIKLRNESYQPLCLPTLFVDIVTKDYVPESFSDFADALSNPMKYLSEKEKRTQQLEAFEFEESDSTIATNTPEFLAPELQNISAIKRGSIVSLQTIINQDKRDKRDPGKIEIKKSQNDSLGNRTQSEVFGKPDSPVEQLKRTFSTPSSQDNHIRHDILKISAPSIDTLKEHKLYKKLQQKFDTDFLCLMQKQAKERILYRKELEVETKKLTLNVERQKSAMQKNHNKLLKVAQTEGNYNEVYNNCLAEIKQLNIRHEQEIESLMNEQKKNMKEQFIRCYEEQYDFLKNKVEPKISELKKILHMFEVADRKKLDERHLGDMMTLKKDQDKFNRGELKDIMRKSKDKLELQKMKRVQNKKHIEQSVIERQSMKEFQEKETQILIKKYEEQINILDQRYEKEMKELEQIFAAKCALLDSQDLQVIVPDLANNVSDVFTS